MKKVIFALIAFAGVTAMSCKKENNDKPSNSTATIQGNWKVSTILTVEPGADPSTYQGTAEDYYKFQTTGTVDVKVGDYVTSVPYQMVDASHVSIDGDVEEIKELTDHKLVIHSPATAEVPEDMTFTLTR